MGDIMNLESIDTKKENRVALYRVTNATTGKVIESADKPVLDLLAKKIEQETGVETKVETILV